MLGNRVLYNLISRRYAGHSKWANIKHIKATKDAQRSALFTKLSRQMKVAIQEGGSANPDTNLRLSQVIEQAKRQSMPAATIQNVVRSNSRLSKSDCKLGLLELRGPQGCVVLCQVLTDNMTRCRQNIAAIIKKHGTSFSDGGGRNLFEQKGIVQAQLQDAPPDEEQLMEHAIDSGAEDVRPGPDNTIQFICEPKQLATVRAHLEALQYSIIDSGVEYLPKMCIPLQESYLQSLSVMFDKLENQEEVVKLYDNIA